MAPSTEARQGETDAPRGASVATAADYAEHYHQLDVYGLAHEIREAHPKRCRQYNPASGLALSSFLSQLADVSDADYKIIRHTLDAMGGRIIDGLGLVGCNDTADQIGDQIAKSAAHVRNVLARACRTGLLEAHPGTVRWLASGARRFTPGRVRGPRVLTPGRVLIEAFSVWGVQPPSCTSATPQLHSREEGEISTVVSVDSWSRRGSDRELVDASRGIAREAGSAGLDVVNIEQSVRGDRPFPKLTPSGYRCQVHEVADPEGDGNWVKGFEFRPDEVSVVHHSIVYRVPAAAADEVMAKIAAEDRIEAAEGLSDEPGWTCFGLSGLGSEGVYSIQGWAPGQSPTIYPDGYGLYLWPGDMIVNQIHYHYDHDTPPDGSWIILDTATAAEVAAGMTHITGSSYLTPAEVPCTPEEAAVAAERAATIDGYVDLCVRANVLAEIGEKYDDFAPLIPGLLLAQCGGTVDDYDDLDGSIGYSSCDLPARNTGTIHTVLGHMHEFGAAYRMTLHPGTPEERILLDIPVWDFEWQLNYEPVEDIRIQRGDMVRFECWWDRTLLYMPEPRYITWNEGTVDEMCFSSIAVLPD
ncbi:MAG: hypothetical protein OXG41_09065 [Acidimicrobiaceae bacterium]|nr:hypothetical protein [Acidimicrobiaceae bacterium]